ncbi:MAG TPA: hypothetical protein VF478_09535, partial [Anaerolineae bacterium]
MRPRSPFSIFFTRLWAFLNYRTRIGCTWLELLSAMLAGMMLVWIALRDWIGFSFVGPLALYIMFFGFYRELQIPISWVRSFHDWLYKPLAIKPQPNKLYYRYGAEAVAVILVLVLWQIDPRLSALTSLLFLATLILLWGIHNRETLGGALNLDTIAPRVPIAGILRSGEIVHRDGTRARVSIVMLGRSGYKPALKEVDVADLLTKFLAYLAQHEGGGIPIKLFWLADYHLGRLDVPDNDHVSPAYLQELRELVEVGARRARIVITGIVYPSDAEPRIREALGQLDYTLAPVGAFAAEALVRMMFGDESFLGQMQQAMLQDGSVLPRAAYRGYLPEALSFDDRVRTSQNILTVTRIDTPFPDAREALMRALHAADGMLSVTLTPLPRDTTATETRGSLLAARVPGFGRPRQAKYLRQVLQRLEDPRSLEYLFDTQVHYITWGKDERTAQTNQSIAESYLTALNLSPLSSRKLEDSMEAWLPTLSSPRVYDRATRVINWLTSPPAPPTRRLLTSDAIAVLAREEGSDTFLADPRGRILLGRSITPGKEGLRYAEFRSDTGPVLLVSDQGGGKTSTLITWFVLRLQLLNYKTVAINLKYSTRMQAAVEKLGGMVIHPEEDLVHFEQAARSALESEHAVIYQPRKGTRPFAIADDPCLLAFMKIFYEEWLPHRDAPAALVIDEIHRLMPKDSPLSANAAETATLVAETFKDWAERKLVIAAATQTLRDLLGSNLGIALQKFRTVAYFQVGPEDREMLIEKGYEPALIDLIVGARR